MPREAAGTADPDVGIPLSHVSPPVPFCADAPARRKGRDRVEVFLERLFMELAAIVAQLLFFRAIAWVRTWIERPAGAGPPAIA